ncbi:MAG: AzlD domain-containing protein [Butyricicoccus sp.]|nr:AzlD domain-containing protein [Butyricicoccus sp.]
MIDVRHSIALIAVMAVVTAVLRFLPYLLFPEGKQAPRVITYLSGVLPSAVIGMLVVYCFKDVHVFSGSHGLPELIALAAVAGSYVWKRNTLLSVLGGTVIYMALVQLVF